MDMREALEAAFDSASEAVETVEPAAEQVQDTAGETEPAETASEKEARERDERGRFKAKDEGEPEAEAQPAEQVQQDAQPEAESAEEATDERTRDLEQPPSSFKKEFWDDYKNSRAAFKEYLHLREQQAREGVGFWRHKAEQLEPRAQFAERLEQEFVPYSDLIQRLGTQPEQVVRSLMQTAKILYDGDRLTKAALIQKLAIDHGLTTDDFAQAAQVGPQAVSAQQEALAYKAELERLRAEQARREEAQTLAAIEEFRARAPHFDALRDQMAGLLQAKLATDLQDAYDKALRLHPELAPAQQAQMPAKERQYQAAKAAKAAAVSPRSTTATVTTTNPQDRRELLTALVEQQMGASRV